MKLTVSSLSCPDWDLPKIVEVMAANKISGVDFRGLGSEIDITKLPQFNAQLDQTLRMFKTHGLSMPCFNTSVTLVSPAPERWEAMLNEAQRYGQLASQTHTPFLRIFGGAVPKGMTRDEARTMAQRHLRQLVKLCKPCGCIPLLETHDDWSTSSSILELIHEFDPRETGVLWDLEHPAAHGETPGDTAKNLRRFIHDVHVKDTKIVDGKRHPALLGTGIVPLAESAAALREIGYEGWYCLEVEKRWDPESPDPQESIPAFVKYMRNQWNR